MGDLIDTLGNRAAGELIRADDWNALVAATDDLKHEVESSVTELKGLIQDLSDSVDARLTDLDQRHERLRTDVEPLLRNLRVTMETTKTHFAVGELAEITAIVTDLKGAPLDLSDAAARPWVDFVTVWGRLKPVGGSDALAGVGERTLSVRVDPQGRARVRLQAEAADGLDDSTEDDFAAALQTVLPATSKSVAQSIVSATTPAEAKSAGAFALMTTQYERRSAPSFQKYVDSYYVKNASRISGKVGIGFSELWHDYRSVVLAFVKPDSDPLTPDASLGGSTVQVRWRDWIGPWILHDYLDPGRIRDQVGSLRDRFVPKITDDFSQSLGLFKIEIDEFVRPIGLVGKLADYKIVSEAIDGVTVPGQPPPFFTSLTQAVQQAVTMQQSIETSQVSTVGAPEHKVAFEALTGTSARSDAKISTLESKVSEVEAGFSTVGQDVAKVRRDVGTLGGRVDVAISQSIGQLDSKIETVKSQINQVEKLYPEPVKEKLLEFNRRLVEVDSIKAHLGI